VSARAAAAAKAASDAAAARKAAADSAKAGQLPGVVIPEAHNPAEGPFPSKLWGVDVACWQHPAGALLGWGDLASTQSGAAFAFVKLSEGLDFTNVSGVADRATLKAQKTLYGGYHYAIPARPVNSSAVAQARFAFAQTGKLTPGQLPMVLDFESNPNGLTPQEMATWALTWLKETSRLTGRQSIFYTYPAFFGSDVAPRPELAAYPLWIANYGLELRSPSVPAPWTTWTFWQYSSQGEGLPGQVSGTRLDLNVFGGTLAELRAMAGIVTVSPSRAGSAGQAGADMMGEALLRALTAPSPSR
jgi:lysozyme